jgi:uncharacterized protein YndB with AHSA1/START domain
MAGRAAVAEADANSLPAVTRLARVDLERRLEQSPQRVWKALTHPKEVAAWMKFPVKMNPEVGGTIFVDFSGRGSMDGVICTFDAPQVFAWVWGDSLVRWEIEREGDGVRLRFAHIGMKPELLAGLTAGWQRFLDQLETHLDGVPRADRFQDLEKEYAVELPRRL